MQRHVEYDERLNIRVTSTMKRGLVAEAKRRRQRVTDYVRDGFEALLAKSADVTNDNEVAR
jgi:hypothetical protein